MLKKEMFPVSLQAMSEAWLSLAVSSLPWQATALTSPLHSLFPIYSSTEMKLSGYGSPSLTKTQTTKTKRRKRQVPVFFF